MIIASESNFDSSSDLKVKNFADRSSFLESPRPSACASRIQPAETDLEFKYEAQMSLTLFKNYDKIIKEYVKRVKKAPLFEAENELYSLNKLFHEEKPGKIRLKDLIFSYSIYETGADSCDVKVISDVPQPSGQPRHPNLSTRHKILKKAISLLSVLSVKWKLFNHSAYHYRSNLRIQFSKILNLDTLNSQCFNLDTLWFCSVIQYNLLEELSTTSLKQYSRILEDHTDKIFEKLTETIFEPPSEPKKKKSCCLNPCKKKNAVSQDQPKVKPDLDLPNFLSRRLSKSAYSFVIDLYTLLQEFETCYRLFEKELVGRFINLSS